MEVRDNLILVGSFQYFSPSFLHYVVSIKKYVMSVNF